MKKLFILVVVAMAVFSCSTEKEEYTPVDNNKNGPVEIQLNAGVLDAKTRAPVTSGTNISAIFVASNTSNTYTSYQWSDTLDFVANQTPTAALSFTPKRYYPANGNSVYLRGYFPSGTLDPVNKNLVSYAAKDGSVDVLLTDQVSGTKISSPLNFVFAHKLTQLQFKFVAGTGFPTGKTVKTLTIKSNNTFPTQLNLNTGALTFSGDSISFTGKSYSIAATPGTVIGDYPMISPGTQLKLVITTDDLTYPEATVNLTTVAGQSHIITITFNLAEITTTVSVTDWITGTGGGTTVQ